MRLRRNLENKWKMYSYLFIGGAGFIGSNIIRYLLSSQIRANIVVLEPQTANISRLDGCNVTIVRGSLEDTDLIGSILITYKCSHVFHLVSQTYPNGTYNEYLNELQHVVLPTIRVMELCKEHGATLVYFSSGGAIYGENPCGCALKETDALNPISYYGLSKLIIEANIRLEHRTNNLDFIIIRPSNPYGIGQGESGKQGIIPIAIRKVLNGEAVEIWGDGSVVRDYIYIEDLAMCVCDIIKNGTKNITVNVGSGEGVSLREVLKVIEDVVATKVRINYKEKRKCDVSSIVLDTTIMHKYSSFNLTTLRQGITKLYNHFLHQK